MSLLFLKRVLANPLRVGYVVPSSPFLTRQTARRLDFSRPRVVVELGPGEGCHTREIVKRMDAKSRLILFELDEEFVGHLRKPCRAHWPETMPRTRARWRETTAIRRTPPADEARRVRKMLPLLAEVQLPPASR